MAALKLMWVAMKTTRTTIDLQRARDDRWTGLLLATFLFWIGFICFRAYAEHRRTEQLQSRQDFMFRERPVRSNFGVVDSSGLLYFSRVEHFQTSLELEPCSLALSNRDSPATPVYACEFLCVFSVAVLLMSETCQLSVFRNLCAPVSQ